MDPDEAGVAGDGFDGEVPPDDPAEGATAVTAGAEAPPAGGHPVRKAEPKAGRPDRLVSVEYVRSPITEAGAIRLLIGVDWDEGVVPLLGDVETLLDVLTDEHRTIVAHHLGVHGGNPVDLEAAGKLMGIGKKAAANEYLAASVILRRAARVLRNNVAGATPAPLKAATDTDPGPATVAGPHL